MSFFIVFGLGCVLEVRMYDVDLFGDVSGRFFDAHVGVEVCNGGIVNLVVGRSW